MIDTECNPTAHTVTHEPSPSAFYCPLVRRSRSVRVRRLRCIAAWCHRCFCAGSTDHAVCVAGRGLVCQGLSSFAQLAAEPSCAGTVCTRLGNPPGFDVADQVHRTWLDGANDRLIPLALRRKTMDTDHAAVDGCYRRMVRFTHSDQNARR